MSVRPFTSPAIETPSLVALISSWSGVTPGTSARSWKASFVSQRSTGTARCPAAWPFQPPGRMKLSSKRRSMASRSETMSVSGVKRAMVMSSSSLEARAVVSAAPCSFFGSHIADSVIVLGSELRELTHQVLHQVGGVAHVKEELDAREVHAPHLCEVPDHAYALQIVIGVKADVRLGPDRFEQALLLVDPQRPRVAAREAGRDEMT